MIYLFAIIYLLWMVMFWDLIRFNCHETRGLLPDEHLKDSFLA